MEYFMPATLNYDRNNIKAYFTFVLILFGIFLCRFSQFLLLCCRHRFFG